MPAPLGFGHRIHQRRQSQIQNAAHGPHQVDDGICTAAQRLRGYVGHQRHRGRAIGAHGNQQQTQHYNEQHQRAGAGHTVTPAPWPGALVVEFAGSPAASAAFKKGLFHVQGLASQFAALCVDAQPGQQVLDLCAAPGGKSLTLAEAMQDKGQLVSGEFVPSRVPLLQQAFDRCGITCAVAVENDATQHNSDWPTFDRVLCDVPCSGLGVIAKKPDIRYKDLDGIENLLAAQQKILQNGADSLAENGRLVYSTCTVNDKENQAQVEKFLSANPDFHVVLPKTALPGADITPLGTLFLPHRTGTDGFFAAILERN